MASVTRCAYLIPGFNYHSFNFVIDIRHITSYKCLQKYFYYMKPNILNNSLYTLYIK